jgi:hypothetical protein
VDEQDQHGRFERDTAVERVADGGHLAVLSRQLALAAW